MAKKITGNPYIDQFAEYQDFVKRLRVIASVLYFETPSLVYAKSVFDYERIIILIDSDKLNLSGYEKTAVEPSQVFDRLKEFRKTLLEAGRDLNGDLVFKSKRKGFEGDSLTLLTNQSKSVVSTGKDLGEMIKKEAYKLSDGSIIFDDLLREVLQYDAIYTIPDDKFLKEFFENGIRYFNDSSIESDYASLMISRESFPLLSPKTKEFSYRVLGQDEEYADILYKEKEEGYIVFTYIRYMIN